MPKIFEDGEINFDRPPLHAYTTSFSLRCSLLSLAEKRRRAAGVLSTREVTGRGGRRPHPIPDLQFAQTIRPN